MTSNKRFLEKIDDMKFDLGLSPDAAPESVLLALHKSLEAYLNPAEAIFSIQSTLAFKLVFFWGGLTIFFPKNDTS